MVKTGEDGEAKGELRTLRPADALRAGSCDFVMHIELTGLGVILLRTILVVALP